MSNAVKNVMLRVIGKRLEKENLEDIFADYPRLSDADREQLRNEFGGSPDEKIENDTEK